MQSNSIHIQIEQTAIQCTKMPKKGIDLKWYRLLDSVLTHWEANVRMDLWDAVKIMKQSAEGKNYVFWYSKMHPVSRWRAAFFPSYRAYVMYKRTIAIFETINYWCHYEDPISINFNQESLLDVLEKGRIAIEWNDYQLPKKLERWEVRHS